MTSGAPQGFGVAFGKGRADTKLMMNAGIHIHEDLRLEVEGHADMRGINLSAKSLDALFNSLLLESVQDLSKSEQWNAGLGISTQDISNVNGQISKGMRHAVREISSILGTDRANIVVANALRLNGGMIAAAHRDENGAYTEHGKLTLRVGEFFFQHIYDYDNGYTLGTAIATSAFAPVAGGHSASGTTFATIGKGDVSCDGTECHLDDVNTDVTRPQTWKKHYDIQAIHAYIPTDMPVLPKTADGNVDWNKVGENVKGQVKAVLDPLKHIFSSMLPADTDAKASGGKKLSEPDSKIFGENYKKEQAKALQAMKEIDAEIADYPETKEFLGPEAIVRKAAVELTIYALKEKDPTLSTLDAFEIALPCVLKAWELNPKLFKASAGVGLAIGSGIAAGTGCGSLCEWTGIVILTADALYFASTSLYKILKDNERGAPATKKLHTETGSAGSPQLDPDDDEQEERIQNPIKADSPVWKKLRPYRGKTKTNGLSGRKKEYYEWDNTHKDIEAYDHSGRHLGSLDPKDGRLYKRPDPKKRLKL